MSYCTCQEREEWHGHMRDGREQGPEPSRCSHHPRQTIYGDRYVSTAMRKSSALASCGVWYEETLAFHFDGTRKHWIGGPYNSHLEGLLATFTDDELNGLCIDFDRGERP